MLVEIVPKELLASLIVVAKVASVKTSSSATSCILFSTFSSGLRVSATNFEESITAEIPCSVSKEGKALIDASRFLGILKTYSTEESLILKSTKNGISIRCGNNKAHDLYGQPVDNFPNVDFDEAVDFKLNSQTMADMLSRVSFLVAENEERPQLSGINISVSSNILYMRATNALLVGEVCHQIDHCSTPETNFTIPKKALNVLSSVMQFGSELKVGKNDNKCFFRCGNFSLSSALNTNKFPDVRPLFFDSSDTILVDRKQLIKALIRAAVISDKIALINEFHFKGHELTINVDSEVGSSDEVIPISGNITFSCLFRNKQVTDVLSTMTSELVKIVCGESRVKFNLVDTDSIYESKYYLSAASMK